MKKILIAIAALLAVFSLRSIAEELAAPSLLEPVGVKRDTVQVTRGTIKQMLYFEGDVVAETTELWFSVDGEIESVSVLLGQAVKKGDVLITLSEKTLRERVLALEKQIEHQERMDEYDFELAQ